METKEIILSIIKSNAICLGINYTLYFFIRLLVKTDESLTDKQSKVVIFCTFLNGFLTSILNQGMLVITVISGMSYSIFDDMVEILILVFVDKNTISEVIADYKYNLYGSRENAILFASCFILSIMLSILGWLVYLGMSYFYR